MTDGDDIIRYTVEEVKTDVITGTDGKGTYADSVTGDMSSGFVIANSHTPENPVGPVDPDDPDEYFITYKLNGGSYNGSTEDIVEKYEDGTVITIHEAPVRDGYKFLYWKGSEYHPGDKYTVREDHTLEAQWEKTSGGSGSDSRSGTNHKTGDELNVLLWLTLMGVSMTLVAATGWIRRRRRR